MWNPRLFRTKKNKFNFTILRFKYHFEPWVVGKVLICFGITCKFVVGGGLVVIMFSHIHSIPFLCRAFTPSMVTDKLTEMCIVESIAREEICRVFYSAAHPPSRRKT